VSEEEDGITILFFDKPNISYVEEETLGQKINHEEFFTFLAKKRELHVRFYWRSNESESSYGVHLRQLRINLQAQGVRFESIETDKDVDIAMLNDMFTMLFDTDDSSAKSANIILCSGDKAFSVILGAAKRRFDIPTTIISGKNHCAEVLKKIAQEVIFIEDMVDDNESLLLKPFESEEL